MRLGVSPVDVAAQLARELDIHAAKLFADVVSVQHRRGGDLGTLCHRLSQLLHQRARLDREARSLTAQARFTARAVLVLPGLATLLWAWRSPGSFTSMLHPGTLVLASPAFVLLAAGIVVVRTLAVRATELDRPAREPKPGIVTRGMRRACGAGTVHARLVRGACVGAMVPTLLVAVSGHISGPVVLSAAIAVACGAAWPYLDDRRRQRYLAEAAQDGLATLLEVSIALLAAGALPHEVVLGAIDSCPGRLGAALRPAAAQARIGRSLESALAAVPEVGAAPELDAWLHALTSGARHGAPAGHVLDTLLRDARSAEREAFRARAATMGPRIQLAIVLLIVPALLWLVLLVTTTGLVRQLRHAGVLG
jgi:Flp pilus assembly protein TadB